MTVLVLAAWFGYRLSEGPLSLSLLSPYIEDALSSPEGGYTVELDRTVLAWSKETRTIEIRVENVRAVSGERGIVASVPEMTVALSGPALLRGQIAPRRLLFRHPVIRLRRDAQGQVQLGLGNATDTGAQSTAAMLEPLRALLEDSGPDAPGGQLRRVDIEDGDLNLEDQVLGVQWHAPRVDVRFNRDHQGITAHARIDLQLAGEQARFDAEGVYRNADRTVQTTLSFGGIRPPLVASLAPQLAPLGALHLPTGGTVTLHYSLDQGLSDVRFDLVGGEGVIDASVPFGISVPVASVSFKGALTNGLTRVALDELRIDLGGPLVTVTGTVDDLAGATTIEAQARVDDMPVDELKGLWPPEMAPNPRTWILANLSHGVVRQATAQLTAHRPPGKGLDGLVIDSLTGEVRPEGVTVQYLSPMPVVENAVAVATYDANAFTIDIKSGDVAGLKVVDGKIILSGLSAPDQFADISVKVTGAVSDVLRLIDHKPLGWAQALGVQPAKVKGEATTNLSLRFPLLNRLTFDQMKVRAQAQATHFGLPDVALGLDLSDGQLSVDVDPSGLDVAGKALLGGIPSDIKWRENFSKGGIRSRYQVSALLNDADRRTVGLSATPFQPPFLSGVVPVDLTVTMMEPGRGDIDIRAGLTEATMSLAGLNWEKVTGVGAQASALLRLVDGRLSDMPRFAVSAANGFDLQGLGSFDKGQLRRIVLSRAKWSRTEARGTVTIKPGDGGLGIDFSGNSFDAREIVSGTPSDHSTDKAPAQPPKTQRDETRHVDLTPLAIGAKFAQVWVSDEGAVHNLTATMIRDHRDWRQIRVDGTVSSGKPLHVEIQPAAANHRSVKVTSSDAGAVFKDFDIYENVVGGQLLLDGSYDDANPRQPLSGQITVSDFQMVRAPALARLLTVASLTGIVDLLQGTGIPFASLEAPFTLTDGVLALNEVRASGTSLGITAKGEVDLDNDVMALEGTVVPIYALNSALGKIPVLGSLFAGEKGGGVFAMNYSMNGPTKDPSVTVNPLSAFTPGMLRRLFDIFDNGSETEVRPKEKPPETMPTPVPSAPAN